MLQQMQHIQHAGADLSAEELRFSTSDLLQALKVCMPVPWGACAHTQSKTQLMSVFATRLSVRIFIQAPSLYTLAVLAN